MQASSSEWAVDRDAFSITIDLNPPHVEELVFDGKYNPDTKNWSGTWEGDEYGTHYTGKWRSNGHK